MNSIHKTLYIPLYGKAYASQKKLFLHDPKAEEIWAAEGFPLRGKAKSKWLAYFMAIRSAVFDAWVKSEATEETIVLHLGCGLDSRVLRVGTLPCVWYDVDFPEVIEERKLYFSEREGYYMLGADIRSLPFDRLRPASHAVVVMEGVSMYLTPDEIRALFATLDERFERVSLLMDCYSVFAAAMSKLKNPIRTVGVTSVYGIDDPATLQQGDLRFETAHSLTPTAYIEELHGTEKRLFQTLYAGRFSKSLYRLYEYRKHC